MATPADICNQALGRIGEARIVALTDSSTAGRAAALHYEATRDAVLRAHRWNFAMCRKELTAAADAPEFGYDYQFPLPADCLRVLEVNDTEEGGGSEWCIEGRNLLTDEDTAQIVYIRRVTEAEHFDPIFVQALVLKLAEALAPTLRGSSSDVPDFTAEYERITRPLAMRIDSHEGRSKKPLMPSRSAFIDARFNGV